MWLDGELRLYDVLAAGDVVRLVAFLLDSAAQKLSPKFSLPWLVPKGFLQDPGSSTSAVSGIVVIRPVLLTLWHNSLNEDDRRSMLR